MPRKTPTPKSCRIGFLGAGKMGGAILQALLDAKMTRPSAVTVCDASAERLQQLADAFHIKPAACAADVVAASDVVFLAVKPQDLGPLLEGLPEGIRSQPLYLSIVAGRRLDWMEARLPGARVIRSMPNLGVMVGLGMTVYCGGSRARKADLRLAGRLLGSTGLACQLPEEQLDAVTALSGSGPAFLTSVLGAMVAGGVSLGLEPKIATTLAVQTMVGTAGVLAVGDMTIPSFVRSVTSAKGTTAAGLAVLEQSTMAETMKQTLAAAANRSRELSQLP